MTRQQCFGTFWWNELVTPDPDGCKRFFGELVGWTWKDVPMPDPATPGVYTLWLAGERQIGGMFRMEGPNWTGIPPHWMGYIAVPDVDDCARRVPELGGEVKVPPMDIPNVGRFCVIADPSGAVVSLITPKEGG